MYNEYDISDLSKTQRSTLRRIGALSIGFRVPVPVGLRGIDYGTVQSLQDLGMVVVEWGQHTRVGESQSIFNEMGWNVRLTDSGINALRAGLSLADDEMPVEGDPTSGEEWLISDDDVPVNESIGAKLNYLANLLEE